MAYFGQQVFDPRETLRDGLHDGGHHWQNLSTTSDLACRHPSILQTIRTSMHRFSRLTNACSKKLENHAATVALYFMYYNFARVHQTLRVTPAMEAGIADHVWSAEEIVGLLGRS